MLSCYPFLPLWRRHQQQISHAITAPTVTLCAALRYASPMRGREHGLPCPINTQKLHMKGVKLAYNRARHFEELFWHAFGCLPRIMARVGRTQEAERKRHARPTAPARLDAQAGSP